jgi:hypothetical protein
MDGHLDYDVPMMYTWCTQDTDQSTIIPISRDPDKILPILIPTYHLT